MSDASIKVMSLLDELEEMLGSASKVPFSEKAVVDADEVEQIIKDIRLSIPKDIKQAQWVNGEQERIIAEAKDEYNKIILAAKKQAEYLVEDGAIKREAAKRANALVTEAENHNRFMKLRTYEYIDKQLFDMQNEVAKIATDYLQPMNDKLNEMLSSLNEEVNNNRQEMRKLASDLQNDGQEDSSSEDDSYDDDDE